MMARAVHAEWTKLRTVPSTAWLLLALVAFTMAVGAAVTLTLNTSFCPPEGCDQDTTKLSLSGVYLGQAAVVVLAVLAVTNEYASGMIRTTLAAEPRRTTLFAARVAVVSAVVLGGGVLGVLGSLATARIILPGHGFTADKGFPPLSLADGPMLRAAAGTVLYLTLLALLSLGVGTIVRDTAGAITTVLALLYVFPAFALLVNEPHWREWVEKLSPMTAGLAIQATKDLRDLPIGPWAGLGVLAAYAGGAVVLGGVLFKLRDA